MGVRMQFKTLLIAASAVLASTTVSVACSPSDFGMAADDLNRLARATTVEDAQIRARRARNSVELAEMSISSCCFLASMELSESARHLRRAANEDDPVELMDHRGRAIRSFHAAIDNWNARLC